VRVFYKKDQAQRKEKFLKGDLPGKHQFNFFTNTFLSENPIHPDKKEITQNPTSRHNK
jgi:hypothetical protein